VGYLVHMLDYASFGGFDIGAGSHGKLVVHRLKMLSVSWNEMGKIT